MKNILLISDTHGYLDAGLLKHLRQADEVWHAGDIGDRKVTDQIKVLKPLRAVYGNIDGQELRHEFPEDLCFTCEKLKVCITHIGGGPGKYPARVKENLHKLHPGLFICGHSHILKVQFDRELEMLFMNPGAAGIHGFHLMKTALRF